MRINPLMIGRHDTKGKGRSPRLAGSPLFSTSPIRATTRVKGAMRFQQLLDSLPITGVFLTFALGALLLYECGYRTGRWWQKRKPLFQQLLPSHQRRLLQLPRSQQTRFHPWI